MTAIELDGASVLITGAARGIGRATAVAFADRGARVCIGDLDGEAVVATGEELGVHAFALDVTSRDSFASFLAAAQDVAGPPVILVNNAGIMPLGAFLDEDDTTSRATIDVNLWGPILGMRLAAPGMVARGRGHIVNVTSMMGKLHVPGAAVYGASKYAATGLSAAVRDELHGTGVTVTTVLPSAVKTELIAGVPLGGGLPVVEPEQVADAIVGSCRRRQAEVFVPGWMAAYEPAVALAPGPLVGAIRRLARHDRVLKSLDETERKVYDSRIPRD
jgi:NAD(P)-dependent dehydrogenase (short-subunit alcohol dehydrogenase family)